MNLLGTKTLETERLILGKLKIEDAEDMFNNWASDENVTKYLTWKPHENIDASSVYLAFCISCYEKDYTFQWGIELKENNSLIGSISVVDLNTNIDSATIGYCISTKEWNKGIVTESLVAVIKFLFNEVGVNRVEAYHVVENRASGRVMEKCGMKYEGIKRAGLRDSSGNLVDLAVYAILRSDFE